MAADEMQVHLKAKDDLTRELVNATKRVQKLEAQLRDLGDATGPDAERDIRRLTTQLDKAYNWTRWGIRRGPRNGAPTRWAGRWTVCGVRAVRCPRAGGRWSVWPPG